MPPIFIMSMVKDTHVINIKIHFSRYSEICFYCICTFFIDPLAGVNQRFNILSIE